jgi:hypothetical protein
MTETWGLLAKSQSEATTIDEAIATAIASHEADPDSHLGTGESLQSHKASEIIDHLAGSIVADKYTMLQKDWVCNFDSLSPFYVSGTVGNDQAPGFIMFIEYGGTATAELGTMQEFYNERNDWTKYIFYEVLALLYVDSTNKLFFGFGAMLTMVTSRAVGFYLNNTTLYGYLNDSGTVKTVALTIANLAATHNYRFEFDPALGKTTFFVDGVQAGQLDNAVSPVTTGAVIHFCCQATGGSSSSFWFRRMRVVKAI